MKHLNLYESWLFGKKKEGPDENIHQLCKKYHIKNYKINEDGSVDVDGHVNLSGIFFYKSKSTIKIDFGHVGRKKWHLNKIPIKFNRVSGDFNCYQQNLLTLENCPVYVGGSFDVSGNNLETLIDGPKQVIEDYRFDSNKLKDVYGFPEIYQGISLFSKIGGLSGSTITTHGNPVSEILSIVGSEDYNFGYSVKFIQLLNEYSVIRNGDTIVGDRLVEALYELDKKPFVRKFRLMGPSREVEVFEPTQEDFENYKLI